MRKLFFLIILFTSLIATASSPKYEMRAVWLTTNWGLDWPSKPATNSKEIARQKEEMRAILDEVASLGFNTIFFQARTRGEVFYNSQIEPWSHIVSGKPGVSPGYDPLAFVVEECHNRGMECHAWIISIPAGSIRQAKRHGNNATPVRHPEMCIKLKNEWYLDPGHPQTATYLASIAKEIATNYDIDGIHLDYIRYPGEHGRFPDSKSYATYGQGVPLKQWRMNNITHIVHTVSDAVKSVDKSIMVSTAPLGRYEIIDGLPSSDWVCTGSAQQNPILWLNNGDNDFIAPMMYYSQHNFFPYLADWVQRTDNNGYIVAGLGAYRMDSREGNWSLDELKDQIVSTRHYNASGQAFFRMQHLRQFPALAHLLVSDFYRYPALIPPMRNADTPALQPIDSIQISQGHSGDTIQWQAIDGAVRYAVYASVSDSVDITNPSQLIHMWITDTIITLPPHQYRSFAITAIDAYRRESRPKYILPTRRANHF